MTDAGSLIDEIVERVLRELGSNREAARRAPAGAGGSAPPSAISDATAAVSITAPVITGDLLEQSARGAARIRVSSRAILTPSARDFLRQRGVEVVRESPPTVPAASQRWQVMVTHGSPQVTAALAGLRRDGIVFEQRLLGLPDEAASQATGALCRGEAAGVVVFTTEPELVACLANRQERVRGVSLRSLPTLDAVRRSANPNLLAIDPVGKSSFELRHWLQAIGFRSSP
ncbi:MAG: hypothetical protein ACKV0T_04215 [Planctomycetales bacterium]